MKKIIYLLLLTVFCNTASAQNSIFDLMERTDITLQEAQRIAQLHFDSAGTGKGSGYKQFQRWLYERKFHTDESGYYISPKTDWDNYVTAKSNMSSNIISAGNWTELGPSTWNRTSSWNPGTGRLTAVAIHPANEQIIYVGSPGGGIWKTTNGGSTWLPLTDNNAQWMSIFALTIDPNDQNIVYAGTSGSNGLIKSVNAGATWALTGAGPTGTIRKILIHPSNSSIVFACASNGIFRSTNAGTNWTQVHSGSKEDIEFKPNDLNIMYATGDDVYRSSNNGISWTQIGAAQGITNTDRSLVSVSPANPNYVYVVQAAGNLFGRMYKSTDAGLSFITTVVGNPGAGTNYFGYETDGTGTSGQAGYDMAMDVSPTNAAEVYIAGIICWKSTNEASSFTAITAWSLPNSIGYNHADVHGLFWVNSTIYSLSDGGIFKSVDFGDNWTDISSGLGIRQFYRFANSQTNANVITGGAQDNGSVARQASGTWVDWLGADGMEGLVSPTNHLNIWGTSQNGSIYRSTNGGNSYTNLPKPSTGNWVTPLATHPTDETIIYGGWTGVYKSTNSGTSWTNISGATITSALNDLAVAPSDPNVIYASDGNILYVTTNDGASWAVRTAPSNINDIAVDPTDPSKIWIACNSTSNRVLMSTNGGVSFTNISATLPTIVARTIVVDDNTPRGIYVGMNIGVFYQEDGAAIWTDFSDNLPMVGINELEIQKASGKIRVATYGRGVWESPVYVSSPVRFTFTTPAPTVATCPVPATMSITVATNSIAGFSNPITLSAVAGVPSGTTISFGTNPVTPGSTSLVTLNNTNTLAYGTYVITIAGTASGAAMQLVDLTYTLNAGVGPAITVNPVPQVICAGANTSFSITSATATAYQWQISTNGAGGPWTNISNGGVFSNVTTATLNITGATGMMNGYQFRCIAGAACGLTYSNPALLTVNTAPAITGQPTASAVCGAATTSFSIIATGTGLTYQWQVSIAGCAGPFVNIANSAPYSGINTPTLTINPTSQAMSGLSYRCVVNGTCTPSATSNCVILTVNTAVNITSNPSNSTICAGTQTTFTVGATGTTPTYQWQESTNGGASWNSLANIGVYSGVTTAILTLTNVPAGMNGNQYRAIVTGTAPCGAVNSMAGILTVNSAPMITTQPATSSILCDGGSTSFSVAAVGNIGSYQWQLSTLGSSGPWNNITNGGNYSGATTTTLSITGVAVVMNANRYRCIISGACTPAAMSNEAVLVVNTPIKITVQPVAVTNICENGSVSFIAVATGSSPTYQWQESTNGGSSWNNITNSNVYGGATTNILTLTNITAGMNSYRYRTVVSAAAPCGSVNSNSALLNVTPLPVITASQTSIQAGQFATLSVNNVTPAPGLSFSWYLNGVLVSGANSSSYTVTVNNLGVYRVAVTSVTSSCWSDTVTIKATPSSKLFVYPSPNNGQFRVTYFTENASASNPTKQTIVIYDSYGRRVWSKEYTVSQQYQLHDIDMRASGAGIYYIVLTEADGNRIKTGEVVVR